MNLLVFGAGGFIGRHFTKILAKYKYKYFLVYRSQKFSVKKNIIYMDLSNKNHFKNLIKKNFNIDVIYNFAWFAIQNLNKKNSIINFKINKNIINYANDINCKKLIITGSCFEYGDVKGEIRENNKEKNVKIFGYYKKLIKKYTFKNFKNTKIWTRLFYVYGPQQKSKSLIPSIISHIRYKKKFVCRRPFDELDYIYIEDVCKIFIKLLSIKKSCVINISSNKYTKNFQILKIFKSIFKDRFIYELNKKQKKIKKFKGNNAKVGLLGFKSFTNIKTGIEKILYEKN